MIPWKRLICLGLLLSLPAWSWDFRGHRVVVSIASRRLQPATRRWVESCLQHHPDPLARTLEGASLWPDYLSKEKPETAPWHFINRPLGPGPEPAAQKNVLWAIEHFCRPMQSVEEQAEALAFLSTSRSMPATTTGPTIPRAT